MPSKVNLIVAVSENMGIGNEGQLPWRLKKELAYFGKMTRMTSSSDMKNAVLMGRRTWESIPKQNRPLPERINVVLSRSQRDLPDGVLQFTSLSDALTALEKKNNLETTWIIGGSSVYKEAMEKKICDRLYITRILQKYECDTYLSGVPDDYIPINDPEVPKETQEEDGVKYKYEVYKRIP